MLGLVLRYLRNFVTEGEGLILISIQLRNSKQLCKVLKLICKKDRIRFLHREMSLSKYKLTLTTIAVKRRKNRNSHRKLN